MALLNINANVIGANKGTLSNLLPEAKAFLDAAGITDSTQKSAIQKLVKSFKDDNVWDKFKAIYPMIGGTSQTHKFNLKDPRDLDIAFRLNFATGWTHTNTGAKPNGTSAYANTFFNPLVSGQRNSLSMAYYSRTNIIAYQMEMGSVVSPASAYVLYSYNGTAYKTLNSVESARGSLYVPTTGLLIASRSNATNEKYYHNGILIDNLTVSSIAQPNRPIYIGAINNGEMIPSSKECAFSFIGDGLTDTEAFNIYNAITAFQTTLGRAI